MVPLIHDDREPRNHSSLYESIREGPEAVAGTMYGGRGRNTEIVSASAEQDRSSLRSSAYTKSRLPLYQKMP